MYLFMLDHCRKKLRVKDELFVFKIKDVRKNARFRLIVRISDVKCYQRVQKAEKNEWKYFFKLLCKIFFKLIISYLKHFKMCF